MTPGNDDLNEMVEDTSPESRRATRGPVSGSDPALAALHAALTDLASDPAPTPTGELAALLDGTVRPLRGGGRRRHVGTVGITIASVVTLSATAAAAITGVAPRAMDTIEGLLPGRAAQAPASSPAPGPGILPCSRVGRDRMGVVRARRRLPVPPAHRPGPRPRRPWPRHRHVAR